MNTAQKRIGERQSRICQFVYAYLLHNIQFVSLRQTAKGENVKNEDEFREKKI